MQALACRALRTRLMGGLVTTRWLPAAVLGSDRSAVSRLQWLPSSAPSVAWFSTESTGAASAPVVDASAPASSVTKDASPPSLDVKVVSWSGEDKGTLTLHRKVFGEPLRRDILQRCVEYHRAKRRKGNNDSVII
jgi:hypothetical protein